MNAEQEIKDSYTFEDFKEIDRHGCQSGVCSQHVYYADTISFFDKYEDEIFEYIADTYGGDMNEELWEQHTCNIQGYKNATVWQFIETIASLEVFEQEQSIPSGMNSPSSMNLHRYSFQ